MEQQLLKMVTETLKSVKKRGITANELSARCKVKQKQHRAFRECLRHMIANGVAVEHGLRLYHKDYFKQIKGRVTRLNKTFGFVMSDENVEHFVPGKFFMGAMPGDTVMIMPIKSRGDRPEAEIISVVEEGNSTFTGMLHLDDGDLFVTPDSVIRMDMKIRKSDIGSAIPGDKVLCKVIERANDHFHHRIAIINSFGTASNAHNCAQAILSFNGISTEFMPDVLAEARKFDPDNIPTADFDHRIDLRNDTIFTIDGADTKDIDDAISLVKRGDMYELGVHIADVSHYVKPGSMLDDEAFRRGTSIYFASSVVPMLPPELSNGICSLNPNVDRLAFSCIMAIDKDGHLKDFDFKKTIINSRVKGVYSEINDILAGSESDDIKAKYTGLYPTILLLKELADILTKNKRKRGAPDIETVESKIVLDENNIAIDIQPRMRGKSEVFIEEFMLMANEAAASAARLKEIPFVYRVHEPPSEQKLATLTTALNALGIDSQAIVTDVQATELSKLINNARNEKYYSVINMMVLRTMSKAKYFEEPIGHYGLVLKNYAQFTSPIRRYPDLTIHRILSDVVRGTPVGKIKAKFTEFAVMSARQSTETELIAMRVERSCDDCYKAEYMKSHIGEMFDGIITSVTYHGMYVALKNSVEGLIKIENLPAGQYEYDEMYTITNLLDNHKYSIGDALKVKCISVDVSGGKIDFSAQ